MGGVAEVVDLRGDLGSGDGGAVSRVLLVVVGDDGGLAAAVQQPGVGVAGRGGHLGGDRRPLPGYRHVLHRGRAIQRAGLWRAESHLAQGAVPSIGSILAATAQQRGEAAYTPDDVAQADQRYAEGMRSNLY